MLDALCLIYTNKDLASKLNVTPRTIARWRLGENEPPAYVIPALQQTFNTRHLSEHEKEFTCIDLFAGIGGIRLGFESQGGECVFTSEWDQYCQKTYIENFGNNHPFIGDIVKYDAKKIPDHDVLLAGFPCQPFSIAGVSKKISLGRPHGFKDKTQGTLFFNVAQILANKKPAAFMLENVKNLRSHDKGRTLQIILDVLVNELGYNVQWRIIDAQHYVPQHRERIIIAGFREKTDFNFNELLLPVPKKKMKDILHPEDGSEYDLDGGRFINEKGKVHDKYVLSEKLWSYLQNYAEKHRIKGNGFGFGLIKPDDISRTLSARYYKDGSEILVFSGKNKRPRRLTPRECARLMGYPDSLAIPVSDTQAYKQFGNSVAVPVISAVAAHMRPHILEIKKCGFVKKNVRQKEIA
ncbi:MAG: DNA (cytosine-5-)-methyltransferase [Gammaproteobacteria bacterium RIFCSPHIGHO2_12_FULL_45_12]|nr:MAG: DNA (cytosine-5-)-methyltransferase [Gammaproteobacteria bacterium RIFCSPHIGHO2_12_FULL_45_12]